MNLLLDTCTFIWLAGSPGKLSAPAQQAIEDEFNTLFLSDVSIWEITMKYALGKLPLPDPPRAWVPAQAAFFQLRRLSLETEPLYLSSELPMVHRDPFDRLLAAQAQSASMSVLTPDSPFRDLGTQVIW